MVYEWEQHRDICYELYVEQKKSLDEVAEYLRLRYNFTPSRRAYQIRFSHWKFPPKQNTALKTPRLVERVKELWQKNLTDREMIRVLVEEDGFEIEKRELASLRRKLGLRLRVPGLGFGLNKHGQKQRKRGQPQASQEVQGDSAGDSDGSSSDDSGDSGDESEGGPEGGAEVRTGPGLAVEPSPAISVAALSPEELAAAEARRQQTKRAFEDESRERWATKKRRRRTKPYAGLPADPPCPPRFPSETTLEEAKTILQLDGEAYKTFRKSFQIICEQAGVLKKTIAGPEKWESLKDQLIRESIHLRSCMWDKNDIDKKKLAIDIIACDVTKRMRVETTKLTVASAKTVLGLNPEQGRQIRAALYAILAQEGFTSKNAEGAEHWQEIKRKWYASSELLTRLGALEQADGGGTAEPDRDRKVKALGLLARDATRRYREDVWSKGKNVLESINAKPSAKKAPAIDVASSASEESDDAAQLAPLSSVVSSPPASARKRPIAKPRSQPARRGAHGTSGSVEQQPQPQHHNDSRLVPLPTAATGIQPQTVDLSSQLDTAHMLLPPQPQHAFVTNHQYTVPVQGYAPSVPQSAPVYHQHQHQHQTHAPQPQSTSMAVFFKLHPGSALSMVGPTMWISTIESRSSIAEVRAAAVEKYPGAICFAIEGIVKDGKGGELPLPVNDEMELEAYLQHISGNANVTGHSAAPTFLVQLMV